MLGLTRKYLRGKDSSLFCQNVSEDGKKRFETLTGGPHPPVRPPHPNDDPVAEGSVKSVAFPDHAKVVPAPATRYRQLVPAERVSDL